MGMCLPCLSGAEDDVVVTPDPVSNLQHFFCLSRHNTNFILLLNFKKTKYSKNDNETICLFVTQFFIYGQWTVLPPLVRHVIFTSEIYSTFNSFMHKYHIAPWDTLFHTVFYLYTALILGHLHYITFLT